MTSETELEQLLEKQVLREPAPRVDEKVLATIRQETGRQIPSHRPMRLWAWPLAGALAASLALAVWYGPAGGSGNQASDASARSTHASAPVSPAPPPLTEAEIRQSWTWEEPGRVIQFNDRAFRAVRQQQVQQTRWIDPENQIRIELSVPSEELYLVPVTVY